ncbi:MAG: LCP family protein, partial [Paraclostridium sp.]
MKLKKIIITISIVLVFLIPATVLGLLITKSNSKIENSTKLDSIEEILNTDKKINIALFGLDRRNEKEKARSDSIMIASIDINKQNIELVSLLRDTLVEIDGYGKDKLNHAYAYGGAPLAIQTINDNFDLNIDKYIAVDFFSLAKVIDILGGVEVELKDYEAKQINNNLVELNSIEGLSEGSDYISGKGIKNLNGRQAVAYSRIRKEGNGDYQRTERQRNILKSLAKKYQI